MPAPRDADARWRRAVESLSPELVTAPALEITHPDVPDPIRVAAHTEAVWIEGHRFEPLAFRVRLVQDVEGEVPSAELAVDNVGAVLTRWIHASRGGAGARVRAMEVSLGDDAIRVEWEVAFRVLSLTLDRREVRARIGYAPLHDVHAVAARHDAKRSPGLF